MSGDGGTIRDAPKRTFYVSSVLDSARRRLAAHVSQRGKPVIVTGESGTGKSVLVRRVVQSLSARDHPILFDYPRLDFQDVLDIVLKSLRINNVTSAVNAKQSRSLDFVRWCLRKESVKGRYVTLFLDEAHKLDTDVLTGLLQLVQRPERGNPFLGLVLVGLPALETRIIQPEFRGLLRNDFVHFRLSPLTAKETEEFVIQYLSAMGMRDLRFTSSVAVTKFWEYSRGTLSLIDRMCSTLLVVTKRKSINEVDAGIVSEAAALCSLSRGSQQNTTSSADGGHQLATRSPASRTSKAPVDGSEQDSPDKPAPRRADEQVDTEKKPEKPSSLRESPMDRTTNLNKVLKNLQSGSPDVEASALITEDGLMIASALPQDLDETGVAGMSATLLNLGTRAAAELRRGDVQEVIVRGEQGYVVMISAGRGVLLLLVANERAKLGLIFFDMREAINSIKRIL